MPMKRFLMMMALLFIASIAVNAGVKDKVLLYLPNRILDATDIFSLGLGVGPAAKLEFSGAQKEMQRQAAGRNTIDLVREKAKDDSGKTVGRNDPCPCGSGKKFKKCHGT